MIILLLLSSFTSWAQQDPPNVEFWNSLKKLCGNAYQGKLTNYSPTDDFLNKTLVMHVRSCDENTIKIPFFVGEDKSRTWVLKFIDGRIELKHDHRHADGSPEEVTLYGGISTNTGSSVLQMFPADQETVDMIGYAATNVWWIALENNTFTYNLRRIGTDRIFSVEFDLSKTIKQPDAPWGWNK